MTPTRLSSPDQLLVLFYLIGILFIGLLVARHAKRDETSYLLMGRRLTLPAFVATLVATWYGGILGIGEFTYRFGLLNWLTQGLPYYLFAFLFGLFFAAKVRQTAQFTIPDQLYQHYGKGAGLFGSFLIFFLTNPAPHILMVTILLSSIFGISFWWAWFFAILFSVTYVLFGGLRSVVYTDVIQFLLMYLGFFVLVALLYSRFGGIAFLKAHLPDNHLKLSGGEHWQFIFVWFFIALWTFVDPGFYQRCYAAKSPRVARRGVLIAILFWLGFDFLTTTAGLYARALLPGINPLDAFPRLGQEFLPQIWRGIFFVSLLATVMSTLDSNSLLAAITFGRDLLWRLKPNSSSATNTKIGIIVTLIVATLIISFVPSVVRIWYLLGSLCIPSLIFPVTSTLTKYKIPRRSALVSMVGAFSATLVWFVIGVHRGNFLAPAFLGQIQPFFVGLAAAILVIGAEHLIRRRIER